MKRILGLDLGTTSIGWALVNEAENGSEKGSIIRTGVRVVPLTTDEASDFEKGKSITVNAGRTLKRGMRRNLHRYKLRRDNLIDILQKHRIISKNKPLTEEGNGTTYELWQLRAKAAQEEIGLHDFARVLLAINKKRGYKSNRKAKDDGEGEANDAMELAKHLYDNELTPGQHVYTLLEDGKKRIPDFYRSDLQAEFDAIWEKQKEFYPDILTPTLKEELHEKNKGQTWKICEVPFGIEGTKLEGNAREKKLTTYQLRVQGLKEKLSLEHLAIALQEINNQINQSSGYLGAISDRSKELYFNKETVGQYLYKQVQKNPHARLKNQVFYRQDYMDEFERIWETQSQKRKDVLSNELKNKIRDVIIFYQRKLKSQKGLISICELEGKEITLTQNGQPIVREDGKPKKRWIGPRVVPRSSPLFQEFKIWQNLNNLKFENIQERRVYEIAELDSDAEVRKALFHELNVKGKLGKRDLLKNVVENPKEWELKNFETVEGNTTWAKLYATFAEILTLSGHETDYNKLSGTQLKARCQEIFPVLGIEPSIFDFDAELEGQDLEKQASYQLWHLLYSYEDDDSKTGDVLLLKHLKEKFGFDEVYGKLLASITFQDDYGSLSSKAIRKILPYLKEGHEYSQAAELAGYSHSHSLTSEENDKRVLNETLELLPKNSLRNPVVEKILNQMVNVVNAIIGQFGKPDEIRVELARELKNSAAERADMTSGIAKATKAYATYRKEIEKLPPFNQGVRITKNDLVKYRLWKELESNGHKTIYTNTYIPLEKLFSKEFDIEHIIPKSLLFDDSFSNKTLSVREFNRWKSSKTALDAVAEKYGEDASGYKDYCDRVADLYKNKAINRAKYNKLLMTQQDIPDGFIERDLRNSQYISKKATAMLLSICRKVTTTTGSVTDKLRTDWQLIQVLQELNWNKYHELGLTYYEKNKEGKDIPKIKDWSKRNDHRHHAMDAITVAFTKPSHIQYFNYLNARRNESHKEHSKIYGIQQKETYQNDNGKRLIKPPMPIQELRNEAKKHLESILVSYKAKNKVVTRNINTVKTKNGVKQQLTQTPRGQLHKETVYGSSLTYQSKMEKVGPKFTEKIIGNVAKKSHREALLKRLSENGNDPKKAFGGKNAVAKNPIYLNEQLTERLPDKVKLVWQERQFTIRKEIGPDLKIDKVIDRGAQKVLRKRLDDFNGDAKKAFSNLDENPIWLNKEKEVAIKRVTITGVSNAEALHHKKDHNGNEILDANGKPIPVDFVSTGNNHHVAIYEDEKGELFDFAVSFSSAVKRSAYGLPVIPKKTNDLWDKVLALGIDDQIFLRDLPPQGLELVFSMKQNEYFVFPNDKTGFSPDKIDLNDESNYTLISPNLFRVQKLSKVDYGNTSVRDYVFRHHLETTVAVNKALKGVTYKTAKSLNTLYGIIKVRINHLGKIVHVGE